MFLPAMDSLHFYGKCNLQHYGFLICNFLHFYSTTNINAFLIIESVDPERKDDLEAAAQALADLTQKYLGGTAEVTLLTAANREMTL